MNDQSLFSTVLQALSTAEGFSFVCIIAGALLLITLERIFPHTKGQKLFREGFFNDFVLYTLVQSYVLGQIIGLLIRWIDAQTGMSRLHLFSDIPWGWQILFFLITHDFYIYWFHRYQHNSMIFWRLHEAHHSTPEVDWLSGSRSHSLEILINQTIEFMPIVLLGAPPEIAVIKGTIDALWGMYIHSNIDVRSGRLQYIINGPEMHRWHHAVDEQAHNKNYSTKLAIWDWIFGTAYFPPLQQKKAAKPAGYGLGDDHFPKNYIAQHLYAFRKFGRND
jgi:sterol desaturase/sphingolipid hydroxylase (fatty acid hydroxylase superfamily)